MYDKHFGCEASEIKVNKYWDDENPEIPPVSVSIYKKLDTGLSYDVLISSGMSWNPMNFGNNYKGEKWSTELIQYVSDVTDDDINWLLWLSTLPFFDNFALGYGHTVSYSEPLYKGSNLSNFLFLNTLLKNDQELFEAFEASPYPVDLLWVVPITSPEYEEKVKNGLDPILDLFESNKHPIILDRTRTCYINNA